MPIHKQILSKR